jgi:hypothetical protein
MNNAKLIQAIDVTVARRGSGKEDSPIRAIRQVFSTDGILIAENDPNSYTIEQIIEAMANMTTIERSSVLNKLVNCREK